MSTLTRRRVSPIPNLDAYTLEELDLSDSKLEALLRRRRPRLNIELPIDPVALASITHAITHAIPLTDPTPHNHLLTVVAASPPSLTVGLRAHLDELEATTPSHKWNRLWRINDYRNVLNRGAGEG